MIVDKSGDLAETEYKTISSSDVFGLTSSMKSPKWSIIELTPKTGRTHQIRVHMAHI